MAENSHISWTDNTHNEWIGCTKVSDGCDNCYAERLMDTRYGRVKWGKGAERSLTSEANRRKPYAWNRQAEREGRRIRVFAQSLSDVFDEEVPDAWRDALFDTIRNTPRIDWLVLTKRLAKMLRYVQDMFGAFTLPPNAWFGCSVENQATADQRIPELLKLRPLVRDAPLWLSAEPLLGPVNIESYLYDGLFYWALKPGAINWVVVGGESGPGARPMHPNWVRSLREQCVDAGVAFHFKQWGEWAPGENVDRASGVVTVADWINGRWFFRDENLSRTDGHRDDEPALYRVGKKAAGRQLDGREWNEFPKTKPADV